VSHLIIISEKWQWVVPDHNFMHYWFDHIILWAVVFSSTFHTSICSFPLLCIYAPLDRSEHVRLSFLPYLTIYKFVSWVHTHTQFRLLLFDPINCHFYIVAILSELKSVFRVGVENWIDLHHCTYLIRTTPYSIKDYHQTQKQPKDIPISCQLTKSNIWVHPVEMFCNTQSVCYKNVIRRWVDDTLVTVTFT
jgi:hypothetical protein